MQGYPGTERNVIHDHPIGLHLEHDVCEPIKHAIGLVQQVMSAGISLIAQLPRRSSTHVRPAASTSGRVASPMSGSQFFNAGFVALLPGYGDDFVDAVDFGERRAERTQQRDNATRGPGTEG